MKDDNLSLIGKKINEIRKKNKWNLKEIAAKADITAGLLSKIENFRAIPSLPVLHRIAMALDVPMSDLVNVLQNAASPYILVRKNERERENREDSKELIYESLINQNLSNYHLRTTIVTVPANTYRKPISTEALEQVFVITGTVTYGLDDQLITLEEGDALYFDGSIPHSVKNDTQNNVTLFKIYLMHITH